jgi:hypothetical protein
MYKCKEKGREREKWMDGWMDGWMDRKKIDWEIVWKSDLLASKTQV